MDVDQSNRLNAKRAAERKARRDAAAQDNHKPAATEAAEVAEEGEQNDDL